MTVPCRLLLLGNACRDSTGDPELLGSGDTSGRCTEQKLVYRLLSSFPPPPFQLPAHPLGCWRREISAFTQSLQLLQPGSRLGPGRPWLSVRLAEAAMATRTITGLARSPVSPPPPPPPPEGRSQQGVWMSIKSRRLLGKPGRQRQRQGVALKVQHCQPRPALLSIGTERCLNHNTGRPHF